MNLFVNTAKSYVDIMLFDQEKIIKTASFLSKHNHTIVLYEMLEDLKIDLKTIKKIYIIVGPGSYTGLRVGVIFAKTLAFTSDCEIYPVLFDEAYASYLKRDTYAIDLAGHKYYYQKNIVRELDDDVVIDPILDLTKLYESKYLESISPKEVKEIEIFYAKSAI